MSASIAFSLLPLAACVPMTFLPSTPDSGRDTPVELGAVSWARDHDAAFARAKEQQRPVLLLFQEIPG